nr:hypothetical protein [Tanacetum cinerariifolium]
MQKYLLKQQFEAFSVSTLEGLYKGYERFQTLLSQIKINGVGVSHEDANQKFLRSLPSSWYQMALIMRAKPGLDTFSFDDLYNNLRVFEHDVKGTTASSSNTQNVTFVSAENTSSTNDVSTAYNVSSPSVLKSQKEGSSSYTDEINDDDLEEMDLKWQGILQETAELKGTQRAEEEMVGTMETELETMVEDLHIRLIQNIWLPLMERILTGLDMLRKASDLEDTPVNDRYANGMHAVPPPMTRNYIPSGPDVEIDYFKFTYGPKQTSVDELDPKPSEYASSESDSSVETSTSMPEPLENALKVVCEPEVWTDAPIIKEYESDYDNDSGSNV